MEEIFTHFPPVVSQEIVDFARDVAFKWSRYIFTRRVGSKQYGYCTHCGREYQTERLKHLTQVVCPECGSTCTVRASGKGRSRLVDESYFVFYEKSIKDPNTIIARGIYAVRDYRDNYYRVQTQFETIAMYVFEPGSPRMIKRWAYFSIDQGMCNVGRWEKCKSVFSIATRDHIANIPSYHSRQSIEAAVKDTPFRYSTWESYNHEDMVKFFALYAKYPCVEYLTKLGLRHLVQEKLDGYGTHGALNWRGRDLFRVLRLTKQEFNEIRKQKIHITYFFLKVFQLAKKRNWNLSTSEILDVVNFDHSYYFEQLLKLLEYGPIKKIMSYLNKQYANNRKHFYQKSSVLTHWRDYIEDCKKLEMDLTDESVLFPKNVYNAHQNTIKQLKIKADTELDEKIRGLVKALTKKYGFNQKGLLIRPAASAQELINEGKALNHCVGTYANKHAEGKSVILFIRKSSKPKKPFFTVEIIGDRVVQVRGSKNCEPDKMVQEFMEAFKAKKLTKQAKVKKSA